MHCKTYSSAVNCELDPKWGQPKAIRLVSAASLITLRHKNKDWLTQNQDNVSDWSDISIHGLLFDSVSFHHKIPTTCLQVC
jgi:hypothetical protein